MEGINNVDLFKTVLRFHDSLSFDQRSFETHFHSHPVLASQLCIICLHSNKGTPGPAVTVQKREKPACCVGSDFTVHRYLDGLGFEL